jgi:hypothetical protein
MTTNFVYSYVGSIGFENDRAYTRINKKLGINLNNNQDEYICDKYKISMDSDMVFVYWEKNGMSIIKDILNKISNALSYDDTQWDLYDNINECDVIYESNGNKIENIIYYFNNEQLMLNNLPEKDGLIKEKELNNRIISNKSSGYNQNISIVIVYLTLYTNTISETKGIKNRLPIIVNMFKYLYNNLKVFQEKNNSKILDDKINRLLISYIDKINNLKIQIDEYQKEIDENDMILLKEVLHTSNVGINNLLLIQ